MLDHQEPLAVGGDIESSAARSSKVLTLKYFESDPMLTAAASDDLFTVLTRKEGISDAQSLFSNRMTEGSDRVKELVLGFQGGGLPATVHWM
jgi:uncharacterized protein YjhX (UPF0386 family)